MSVNHTRDRQGPASPNERLMGVLLSTVLATLLVALSPYELGLLSVATVGSIIYALAWRV
jgi:hypothetical protein